MLDLQEKFVTELARSTPPGWESLRVHYEYAMVDGEQHEICNAKRIDGGRESQFQIALDALDVLIELNDEIPDGQSERWTVVDITLEGSGRFRCQFRYGVPTLVAELLRMQQA